MTFLKYILINISNWIFFLKFFFFIASPQKRIRTTEMLDAKKFRRPEVNLWLLVLFESFYVQFKIRYQASIKILFYGNPSKNFADFSNGDAKTLVNGILKVYLQKLWVNVSSFHKVLHFHICFLLNALKKFTAFPWKTFDWVQSC